MTYDGRTRVAVMAEPRAGAVDLVMRDLPALGAGEALVKIRHAGICGTDLHIIGWNAWAAQRYRPPFALGHEFCGEVVDIAPGTAFRIGDRVTAETHLACGSCPQCRSGRGHTCDNLKTFSSLDRGAFADYSVVPAALLRKVPEAIPDPVAAIMEPAGIALRCAREAGCEGAAVMVSGCGPIGLMAVAAARAFGARLLLAVDPVSERRAFALRMGADRALDPGAEDVAGIARSLGGMDGVIETSGAPPALSTALRAAMRGGTVLVSGLPEAEVPVDVAGQIVLREVALKGAYGRLLDRTWLDLERALAGPLDIAPVITDRFPLDEVAAAIRCAQGATAGKVLLSMQH